MTTVQSVPLGQGSWAIRTFRNKTCQHASTGQHRHVYTTVTVATVSVVVVVVVADVAVSGVAVVMPVVGGDVADLAVAVALRSRATQGVVVYSRTAYMA